LRRIAAAAPWSLLLLCAAAPAGEQSGGMPQLDFANPLTTSQVVWGAIIFGVLYLLLRDWGLPQIGRVLEHRAATIAADLEAAYQLRAEATATAKELEAAERKAHGEAQAEINRADEQARRQAAQQTAALNEKLEAQIAAAEGRIGEARAAALGALREVAADTATTLVTQLSGRTPSAQAVGRAVDNALVAAGRG